MSKLLWEFEAFEVYGEKKLGWTRAVKVASDWLKFEYVVVWGILTLQNFDLEVCVKTLMG